MRSRKDLDLEQKVHLIFNHWDHASEKVLAIDESPNENLQFDKDIIFKQPPSLCKALEIVRRLHLLSIKQHAQLHQFVTQLQSKLIDVYLQPDISKQKSSQVEST